MDNDKYLYVSENANQLLAIDLELVQHYFLQCRKYTSSVIEAIAHVQIGRNALSAKFVDEIRDYWNHLKYYCGLIYELKAEHSELILLESLFQFSKLTSRYAEYNYTFCIHVLTNNRDEADEYSKKANDTIQILNNVHTEFTQIYNKMIS